MTQVNNWIIGLIDRLHVQFPHCGFSYAYEISSDQHVVELTDVSTRSSVMFRESLLDEMDDFNVLFCDQCILFTDQENDFPLEPPILYKKQAVVETTLSLPHCRQAGYSSVSWIHEWPVAATASYGINGIISSMLYDKSIQQQDTITVQGDPIVVGDYNYCMAA